MPDQPGKPSRQRSGISLPTVLIASAASAAAAFATAHLWGAGTLLSAALWPIIVALVSEFLRRPVDRLADSARTVPQRRPATARARPTPTGRTPGEDADRAAGAPPRQSDAPTEPRPSDDAPAPGDAQAEFSQIDVYRSHRRWWLAVGTGLLAFAIVLVVFTVSDAIAGHSITGNKNQMTFFGGPSHQKTAGQATSTSTTVTTVTTRTTTTSPGTTTAGQSGPSATQTASGSSTSASTSTPSPAVSATSPTTTAVSSSASHGP